RSSSTATRCAIPCRSRETRTLNLGTIRPARMRGADLTRYLQVSATTFTDSTCIIGGRTTFVLPADESSFGGALGCWTCPVSSTFLLAFFAQSDCDDPASTYIFAEPPSTLFST